MADSHAVFGTEPNCYRHICLQSTFRKDVHAEYAQTQPTTVRVLRGGSVTVNGGPDMRILRSALRSEDERTGGPLCGKTSP
jgi:hypothetical protein